MSGMSPLQSRMTEDHDAIAAASDGSTTLGECPYAATVGRVAYLPTSAVTGANTDTRTLTLVNRGAAGTGTTVVATLALTSGVNIAADDAKELTLSGVAGATTVAEGDVLEFMSTHAGTNGLADPGGVVTVSLSRN